LACIINFAKLCVDQSEGVGSVEGQKFHVLMAKENRFNNMFACRVESDGSLNDLFEQKVTDLGPLICSGCFFGQTSVES
jgi:hypothetical protein